VRISERLLTVLAICLLVTAVPAFARGNGERQLKQAQELVDKKQYAEAMTLLAQVMKDFPDQREKAALLLGRVMITEKQFSQAMALLVQIMKDYPDLREQADRLVALIMEAREKFNEKYEELLVVIKEVPPDVERGLAIIHELNDLDPNQNPAIKESIEIARQKLVSAEKYRLFTEKMNEAAGLIADGKLREAIATYRERVLPVARLDFDTAPHPALLRDQALSAERSLEEASRQAETQTDALAPLPAALDALLAAPLTEAGREVFIGKLQPLVQARQLEERIRALGADVRGVNAAIDAANGEGVFKDLWLSFVEQAALGRKEFPPEGIAFAARRPWTETVRKLSDKAVTAADDAFQKTEKAFAGKIDLPTFRSQAADTRSRALLARSVLDVEATALVPGEGIRLSAEDTTRAAKVTELAGQMKRHAADADAMGAFAEAEVVANRTLADLDNRLKLVPSDPNANPAQLTKWRADLKAIRESAMPGAAEWSERAKSAASVPAMAKRAADIRDRFNGLTESAFTADTDLAVRLAGLEAAKFEPRRAEAESRLEKGRAFATGTAVAPAPVGKRPDLAKDEYNPALADTRALLSTLDAWRASWTSERDPVNKSGGMKSLVSEQEDLRDRVLDLQGKIQGAITQAQTAVDTATQLRGQGDSAYQAGVAKENQKKYTDALASYNTSQTSYTDSLNLQENATVRVRLEELSRSIERVTGGARAQNLASVQQLIDRGIRLYADKDYEGAIKILEEARILWEKEAGGPNTTITVYLERATGWLKVTGKQEITRTDPIYEDIRGFMTEAERSYTRAISLKEPGPLSREVRDLITTARSSVQAIMKVVPEYRDARLMDLRIDQLEFGQVIARQRLRSNEDESIAVSKNPQAGRARWQDAYWSLKAYREFEGDTSRLKLIDDAITALGNKLNPINEKYSEAVIKESRRLFNLANAAYSVNKREETGWESALWNLQKSLELWPDNSAARKLQSEIVGKRGKSVDVLSPDELDIYDAALKDFLNRNYSRAKDRLDVIYVTKKQNPLVNELLDRIKGATG
jgi:hypothetical protein